MRPTPAWGTSSLAVVFFRAPEPSCDMQMHLGSAVTSVSACELMQHVRPLSQRWAAKGGREWIGQNRSGVPSDFFFVLLLFLCCLLTDEPNRNLAPVWIYSRIQIIKHVFSMTNDNSGFRWLNYVDNRGLSFFEPSTKESDREREIEWKKS